MFEKFFFLACFVVAVVVSSAAFADGESTAVPRRDMTWWQSMQLLEKNGYTHAIIIQSAKTPGRWIGSASKDGRRVDVSVDPEGKVTQQ
ncbi:MAG TPA: PepSY domain-containing protein [Stellaceae bacterium]|nr:PepSY domain-containing protein [Stellaceae bacterium]